MVTIKDIAKVANVSTATVSYVLNGRGNISEETKKKVMDIVRELNYKPNSIAKSLKINKTSTIGVIVEDITVFNSPEIIDGINESAEQNGFGIILSNLRINKRIGNDFENFDKCRGAIEDAVNDLLSKQVDGILYLGVHPRDVKGLIDTKKPIVYIYCYSTDDADYSVNYDDEQAAYEAASYLIGQGHERIATISGLIGSAPALARFNGYYKAVMENHLTFEPSYIKTGNWQYDSGYELAKELLSLESRPTAIMAMNDLMAGGVLDACRDMGIKVPEEVSVIGFDNREFSFYYTPKLTTVDLPLRQMGKKSIDVIVDLIHGNSVEERKYKLDCQLIVRNTVARLQ
ncbi:Catabolite control protein A [Paenibacillus plantiphilus]|uniref:Catabolite control protein A n=1 Tax=Paenibacillus plantiphilus TaxID=2905650 RepID=A0ABM9CJZ6_9BACL|nr:LacI family DNA-binding transcriptional regulator [Paenibacillus plantiphilus]CAH1216304.1 Catabolite control protein A [Paenibacillus plantiphilus]